MVKRSWNSVSLELGVVFLQKVFYEAKSWDSGLKDIYWSLVKKSVVLKEKGTQWGRDGARTFQHFSLWLREMW